MSNITLTVLSKLRAEGVSPLNHLAAERALDNCVARTKCLEAYKALYFALRSENVKFTEEQVKAIEQDGICPYCQGALDTGFECLDCGANAWTGSKNPANYMPKSHSVFGVPNPNVISRNKGRKA